MITDKIKVFTKVEVIDVFQPATNESKKIRKETKLAIPWKFILFIEEHLVTDEIEKGICLLRCVEGMVLYVAANYDELIEEYENFYKYDNF
jgi:hypothetical protein